MDYGLKAVQGGGAQKEELPAANSSPGTVWVWAEGDWTEEGHKTCFQKPLSRRGREGRGLEAKLHGSTAIIPME